MVVPYFYLDKDPSDTVQQDLWRQIIFPGRKYRQFFFLKKKKEKKETTLVIFFFCIYTLTYGVYEGMIPFPPQSIGSEETQLCLSCFPLPGAIPKTPWQELVRLLCYLFFTVSLLKSSRYRQACFVRCFTGASAHPV